MARAILAAMTLVEILLVVMAALQLVMAALQLADLKARLAEGASGADPARAGMRR